MYKAPCEVAFLSPCDTTESNIAIFPFAISAQI